MCVRTEEKREKETRHIVTSKLHSTMSIEIVKVTAVALIAVVYVLHVVLFRLNQVVVRRMKYRQVLRLEKEKNVVMSHEIKE